MTTGKVRRAGSSPITPRNKTEERVLQALHSNVDKPGTLRELFPDGISPHISRVLKIWIGKGWVTLHPWSRYRPNRHLDAYLIAPECIDPERVHRNLVDRSTQAWQRQMDAQSAVANRARALASCHDAVDNARRAATPLESADADALAAYAQSLNECTRTCRNLHAAVAQVNASAELGEALSREAAEWGFYLWPADHTENEAVDASSDDPLGPDG